jgi:hypothetical protein
MKKIIEVEVDREKVEVSEDGENITIWQGADLVMIYNEEQAKLFVGAIKACASELGWEV